MTRNEALATGAMGALLVGLWFGRGYQLERAMDGTITVGTITAVGGKNLTVSFFHAGTTRYDVLSRPYGPLFEGEQYVLSYDPSDPTLTMMRFWQPVYDKRLYARTTSTGLHRPWTLWGNGTVAFEYAVAGKTYNRLQGLPPHWPWKDAPAVSVYYKIADPRIAYVQL